MATTTGHDDTRPVDLPSGGLFQVYPQEVAYFEERVRRYLEDNHFTNVSDLQDVDRMLVLETLAWRWGTWVSRQRDYWGQVVDESALSKQLKEISGELRRLKSSLGIDKASRDRQRGEESVSEYLQNLRIRAREFGVNRERQLARALELVNELIALVTLHDNCTDDERRDMQVDTDDVLEWIRTVLVPEYEAVDAHFRANQQRFWIRDQ